MSSPSTIYTLGEPVRPTNTSPFPIGWLILVIVLFVIIFVILYFFFRQRTQLVEPSSCPKIFTRYGVRPGVTKPPVRLCGDNQQQICKFNISSLAQAISKCDTEQNICQEFNYDPIGKTMEIVNVNSKQSSSPSANLYIRQINAIDRISTNIINPIVTPN